MIQKTTNYDIFKVLRGNRNLNAGHLSRLSMSVAKRNLLEYNPILVNENMEVVDGQHRLEVAKQNKLPIWYMVAPTTTLQEVLDLNENVRNWKLTDYVDSLIIQGNRTMMYLREFCDEYEISLSNGIALHMGIRTGFRGNPALRLSKMDFTDEQKEIAKSAADLFFDIRPYIYNKRGSLPQSVINACRKIAQEKKAKKLAEVIKNRDKTVAVSSDDAEMHKILMSYVR